MIGSSARQAAVVVADQLVSSATNALLGIGGAVLLAREEYSHVAVPFALYALGLALGRSWLGDLVGARWKSSSASSADSPSAAGVILGFPLAAVCVVFASFSSAPWPWVALAFAWPALLSLDAFRYESIAADGARGALRVDVAWLLLALGFAFFASLRSALNPTVLMSAWCLAGVLAWCLETRLSPLRQLPQGVQWLKVDPPGARRLFIENLGARGALPLLVLIAGSLLSGDEVALFSFARSAAAPVTVVYVAFLAYSVPALRSGTLASGGRLARYLPPAYGAVGSIGVVLILEVLRAVGISIAAYDRGVVVAVLGSVIAAGFAHAIRAELRAKNAFDRLALTQTVVGTMLLLGGLVGLLLRDSALAMSLGLSVASVLAIPVWLRQDQVLRELGTRVHSEA